MLLKYFEIDSKCNTILGVIKSTFELKKQNMLYHPNTGCFFDWLPPLDPTQITSITDQGGIKWGIRGSGILDSEGSHR